MEDLTIPAMAYLRTPLAIAALAFFFGSIGTFRNRGRSAFIALAVMMILFFQAARVALIAFDPFMSSEPLAEAINKSPQGTLIDRSSLLHLLFHFLLYESHGISFEWPSP